MKIGQLSLFNGHIAAWHWKWSITWRWILSARWHNPYVRLGGFWIKTHGGECVHCGFNNPLFDVSFQSQPNCLPTAMQRK